MEEVLNAIDLVCRNCFDKKESEACKTCPVRKLKDSLITKEEAEAVYNS